MSDTADVNIRGLNYANKQWSRFYNSKKTLPNGFELRLTKSGFYETNDQNERLKIALDVLETYTINTAERYFAILKYGGFLQLPNIKNLSLARNYYGSIQRRTPQVRIPSLDQYYKFIQYLNGMLDECRDSVLSTNTFKYSKYFGAIIATIFAANTGLRVGEVLRLTNKHLKALLNGENTIEIKMKASQEWQVIRHKSLFILLEKMSRIFSEFLSLNFEVLLFQFSSEYLRLKLIKFFTIANNNQSPPKGFGLHTIRYCIASELSNTNLKMAQEFLGHKNISTTHQYVKYKTLKLQSSLTQIETTSPLYIQAKSCIV
jgi:integrase